MSLHKSLSSALSRIATDIYSESTRFALELIQNADDNDYAVGEVPMPRFNIEKDYVWLINNELGFLKQNVIAMCDVRDAVKLFACCVHPFFFC